MTHTSAKEDLSQLPIGCGPEGSVSQHADTINDLETLAGSYGTCKDKAVLRGAARLIMRLEADVERLAMKTEGDLAAITALQDDLDKARRVLSEESTAAEKNKQTLAFLAKFAREACVTDSKDLMDWHDDMNYIAVVAEGKERG